MIPQRGDVLMPVTSPLLTLFEYIMLPDVCIYSPDPTHKSLYRGYAHGAPSNSKINSNWGNGVRAVTFLQDYDPVPHVVVG